MGTEPARMLPPDGDDGDGGSHRDNQHRDNQHRDNQYRDNQHRGNQFGPQVHPQRINPQRFDAVLFDLDGVLTDTASVHAWAWKTMFDLWFDTRGGTERDFGAGDYEHHIDGKPRDDGVRDFLASRNITVADGNPGDAPWEPTVAGLGNAKQELFDTHLADHGVTVFDDGVALLAAVRAAGMRTAVVTSSKNAAAILDAAGLTGCADTTVDGNDLGVTDPAVSAVVAGKPAPDMFLLAARRLDVTAGRAVIIEDAHAGVQAGRRGGFGLVVGVDRGGQAQRLSGAGADVVVGDLRLMAPHPVS